VVEPVDVFEGGVLDLVEVAPWSPVVDEFCLVEADHRLGQGVIVRVPHGSNRGFDTGLCEAVAVTDG